VEELAKQMERAVQRMGLQLVKVAITCSDKIKVSIELLQ
jgi:hypothetical protein